jgi:hypothetical protein
MAGLDEERRRAAKNESLIREVNERIEDVSASAVFTEFVCECPDLRCTEKLQLTIEEYERVRAVSNNFVVALGHEVPEVERVIETTDRYLVVAKLAPGDAVAEDLDRRSEGEFGSGSA